MTDIAQARLLKAREIAAAEFVVSNSPLSAQRTLAGEMDGVSPVRAALAALNLADWQPPEDPDERAAFAVYQASGGRYLWEERHRSPNFRTALAAYKAGKAAA